MLPFASKNPAANSNRVIEPKHSEPDNWHPLLLEPDDGSFTALQVSTNLHSGKKPTGDTVGHWLCVYIHRIALVCF
jgi:hypothetical protein